MVKLKDFEDYDFQELREKIEKKKGIFNIQHCPICKVEEGQYHKVGCKKERCLKCGNRIIQCKHKFKEREPYFYRRVFSNCIRCGKELNEFNAFYNLSTKQWSEIMGYTYGILGPDDNLCKRCFHFVKSKRLGLKEELKRHKNVCRNV